MGKDYVEKLLSDIENATLSDKMKKAVDTQVARFFSKSEEQVVDYQLYSSINKYKSFSHFEKMVIAYNAISRLSEVVFIEDFIDYWIF